MKLLPRNMFFFLLLVLLTGTVCAQDFSAIGVSADVFGTDVQEGHVVSIDGGNYVLSFQEYDENVYGIIADSPAIALEDTTLENFYYVVTSGEALVKVTATNGPIEQGDYLTSSRIPGVAQKATLSGQTIGFALEEFKPEDPNAQGEVLVLVNITAVLLEESLDDNLFRMLKSGFEVPFLTPLTSLRYILAALVALVTFYIGFMSFGRISGNSIEALGRNPLASKIIKSAIFLNFMLTVVIIAVGLSISYLILTL